MNAHPVQLRIRETREKQLLVDAGYVALPIALVVGGYVTVASFLGGRLRAPVLVLSARYGMMTVPLLLAISTLALVYAFVTHDFSVRYVAENSSLALPQVYTWVALYAGNAGSLLFIATVYSFLTAIAVVGLSRKLPYTAPYATSVMAFVMAFFLGVIVFLANPLERLAIARRTGRG